MGYTEVLRIKKKNDGTGQGFLGAHQVEDRMKGENNQLQRFSSQDFKT